MAQASLLLGAGCWLTIKGEFPGAGGMMIVASALGGRILAPIVQVIAMWKQVVNARDAYGRLDRLLQAVPARTTGMPLPPPRGTLSVEGAVAGAPGSPTPIIRGVSFLLPAGEVLAVVGPSASGKSTLARLMVGIWPTAAGKVRLDGADVFSWNKAELGPHIGYLPQEVELFDGTLAENIARFGEIDMGKVEAAARAVGVHDAILALPQGYDTRIGDDGCFLSGGQRQRVGLARAIYGNPRFVVLDEPNSSLDEAGEIALAQTLRDLKAQDATVVVITHRTSVLAAVDRMLILLDGQVQAYGPRDEVLAALQRPPQPAQAVAHMTA
jgi:ATP-binding cassette subfamily C exporter for protease/lipase